MLKLTLALMTGLALAAPALAAPADPAPVIAAERAFAARAAVVGVAPSFLEYMTDDAVTLSPDPVNARALYAARPPPKLPKDGGTLLAWWPNAVVIAESGDIALSTGPASINGKRQIFFATIWRKQPDGAWRWVYDAGIQADASGAPGPETSPTVLASADPNHPPIRADEARIHAILGETGLQHDARTDAPAGYRKWLRPDARVQTSGRPPATTPEAVARELTARPKAIEFTPIEGGSSAAGDFVWSYGGAKWPGGHGNYLRVWEQAEIVFDQLVIGD